MVNEIKTIFPTFYRLPILSARKICHTPVVTKGLAIPHIVVEGEHTIKALLVRAKAGVIFSRDKVVHIMFVLVGSSDERVLHLKILAAIAQITQNPGFYEKWLEVTNKEELKNLVLLGERRRG